MTVELKNVYIGTICQLCLLEIFKLNVLSFSVLNSYPKCILLFAWMFCRLRKFLPK